MVEAGPQGRLHQQGLPDPLAHRGGAGRDQRGPRQHERGRLALPHVRHRQGVGLAGRPGRHRVHDQERARRGLRARALRRAVLAHARGPDLPARLRRPVDRLRQEPGLPHLRRRRPHRPRHPAHAVPAGAEEQGAVLQRVLRARPDHGRRGRLPRRHGDVHRGRLGAPLPAATSPASPPAATAASTPRRPRRTPAPATATPWCCAPACRCRTWSSSSSTRRASPVPAA